MAASEKLNALDVVAAVVVVVVLVVVVLVVRAVVAAVHSCSCSLAGQILLLPLDWNLLLWQHNVFSFMAHKMHNVYALDCILQGVI